ncbi:MAG: arginine--tRNA ligase [Chloroflexi bacterium]|nr:arginine--tRNA ligase [Chloroflexota bacterium]
MSTVDSDIKAALVSALKTACDAGELPKFEMPADIPLERPKQDTMGDLATPLCMQLARMLHLAPIVIATTVVKHLPTLEAIGQAEAVKPGYINLRYNPEWLTRQVDAIMAAADTFGNCDLGNGQRVQVEFVSANPTGPLHIGAARNAVLGDAIARVLDAAGYAVQREYYVNDAGSRVRVFGETLYARYAQALGRDVPLPQDGYMGQYMADMANDIIGQVGDKYLQAPHDKAVLELGAEGLRRVVASAEADLAFMGIRYDRWFSEATLYSDGTYDRALSILRDGNHLEKHDGALWFKAIELGGGKDEVVIRSDGTPGYFASDIAYHYNKFAIRGFERVIDVWGADHQGHVPRMRAMMQALGLDPSCLTIILYQLVTLKRGGEVVRLSKRTGDIITLREVLEEVGADAVRFFLLARDADSQMDFDLDLAKEQSEVNPVYYVQYAHARTSSILRFAGDVDYSQGDVSLLTTEAEQALIRRMIRLPEVVRIAAEHLAPHHLAYYAQELAASLHTFYRDCRVVNPEPGAEQITLARLKLVAACRTVLARTLHLMGMTAPDVM